MASNISDVSYDYDEMFLALAKNFFNLEDTSTAKTGMFGYTTGIGSHIAKDATFHRNMLYNEFFLNTATLKSSLFNWSRILDHNVEFASPSSMQVALRLDAQRLMSVASAQGYGTTTEGYRLFRLPKSQIFIVGERQFLLPYELEFRVKFDGTVPSAFARYDMSHSATNFPDETITNEHLKVLVEGSQVVIFFTIYQLSKKTLTYDVMNNDILERSIYDVAFGSNLVSFTLSYQEPTDRSADRNVWNGVTMYFGDRDNVTDPRYAFYTFADEATLRVYFDTKLGAFNPEFNSRLRVEYVTTDGATGNFNYTGNVFMKDSFLEDIGYSIVNLTDATGGADQVQFKESKLALMRKLRSRDSYITEKDLENLFLDIQKNKIRKGIETRVVRVRDDIFHRIFTVYSLMRLSDGTVMPTNTIDLDVPFDEIIARNYSLKPGTIVVYDRDTQKYRLLASGEIPDPYLYSKESYVFTLPYLVNLDMKEYPKANVYQTDYSRDVTLAYIPDTDTAGAVGSLSINSYNVQRNSLFNLDRFVLSCDVITAGASLDGLVVIAKLVQNDKVVGVARMSSTQGNSRYTLNILTDDAFTSEGEYIVRDTFYEPKNPTVLIPEIPLVGKYRIDLSIYRDPFNGVTDTPVIDFKGEEEIGIAEDVTPYVHCPLILDDNVAKVTIRRLPIMGANFFFNEKYHADALDTMYKLFRVLEEADVQLENGTSIDLKFFNTSGVSRYFSSDTTDLRVRLKIKLNVPYSRDLEVKMRADIVAAVEAANYALEKRFSISNLITKLEKKYAEISYIEVFTINNVNMQTVNSVEAADDYIRNANYVPEFLTVRKNAGSDDTGKDFVYDVVIDYL